MMNECLKLDKLKVMSMLNRCWLSLEMPRTAPRVKSRQSHVSLRQSCKDPGGRG